MGNWEWVIGAFQLLKNPQVEHLARSGVSASKMLALQY